jgi:hypothetical protein
MKKVVVILILLFLSFSIESYTLDKRHRSARTHRVERTNNQNVKFFKKHHSKESMKKMQRQRIRNHDQKKTNNMKKR